MVFWKEFKKYKTERFFRCYYCESIIKACYVETPDSIAKCPICHQEDTLERV